MERQSELVMRFLAEPGDVNFGGKVHGGAVMKWIDQAGYATAVGWSQAYCVTVYVGGIRFLQPVSIGDMVEMRCKLILTGKTSMHISVEVIAYGLRNPEPRVCTTCIIIFVAMDDDGKPLTVPPWIPVTPEDKKLEIHARRLMEWRKTLDNEA